MDYNEKLEKLMELQAELEAETEGDLHKIPDFDRPTYCLVKKSRIIREKDGSEQLEEKLTLHTGFPEKDSDSNQIVGWLPYEETLEFSSIEDAISTLQDMLTDLKTLFYDQTGGLDGFVIAETEEEVLDYQNGNLIKFPEPPLEME